VRHLHSLTEIFRYNVTNRNNWVAQKARSISSGSRILDVGAGIGQYRPLFSHCEYRTQDFGKEPGTVGRYTQLDYECDITAIPVPDGYFDAVICTEVLEHVPEPIRAVAELARVTRAGGWLWLTAPLGSILHQEPYHYYGGYTPHWYRRFLPENGFDVVEISPNGGFFGLYAQESQRFSALIDPRRVPGRRAQLVLGVFWLLTLPLLRVLIPVVCHQLDRMGLEKAATVGYHISAVKRSRAQGAEEACNARRIDAQNLGDRE